MTRTVLKVQSMLAAAGLILAVTAAAAALESPQTAKPAQAAADEQIGRSFQIPYRLTETNHFLVRVRLNGKGPFNFLVDSGAPALYVATETAKKMGLKPDPAEFWTPIDRLDLEGGARLEHIKARVEDPFQLVGMNALGLPGASIDGILGFTILARFRLEIDLTQDRMTWTRLAHEPRDPPVPKGAHGEKPRQPPAVAAMSSLGAVAKGLALFVGKQPEEVQRGRGFFGLEWAERLEAGRPEVEVRRVVADSPAAAGGIRSGDRIKKINGRAIESTKGARAALAEAQPGDVVRFVIRRGIGAGARELDLPLTAGEGL